MIFERRIMKENNPGFTLVEVMVVVFLMTIISITTPAIFSHLKRQSVQLAADQICVDLQLARVTAINKKRTCTILFNYPEKGQYTNTLTGAIQSLSGYHGKIHFMDKGPDDKEMANEIRFQRRGMAFSKRAIYLSNETKSVIYRIRVMASGGISVLRWNGSNWQ